MRRENSQPAGVARKARLATPAREGAAGAGATPANPRTRYQLLRAQAIKEDSALPPAATFCFGSPKLSSPPECVPIT